MAGNVNGRDADTGIAGRAWRSRLRAGTGLATLALAGVVATALASPVLAQQQRGGGGSAGNVLAGVGGFSLPLQPGDAINVGENGGNGGVNYAGGGGGAGTQGGAGGTGGGGALGGAGGVNPGDPGKAPVGPGGGGAGGGGGGAHGAVGAVLPAVATTGGDGGAGGEGSGTDDGGGGGAGGFGVVLTANGTFSSTANITGGAGGAGGDNGYGGNGGAGGHGLFFNVVGGNTLNLSHAISGGAGGDGGDGDFWNGVGGNGGAGVVANGLILNLNANAAVSGGAAGASGTGGSIGNNSPGIAGSAIIFTGGANRINFNDAGVVVSGAVVATSGSLALGGTANYTLAQTLNVAGALSKEDANEVTLSGRVTVTGATTVNGGTLVLNVANGSSFGGITVDGTLSLTGDNGFTSGLTITTTGSVIDYANGFDNAATINITSDDTQLQVLVGTATQSGQITETGGPRGFEKIGPGTLTLTNATNTYTGTATITAGTLALGASDVLPNASSVVVNGATAVLSVGTFTDTVAGVSLQGGGSITGTSGVLTSTTNYDVQSGSISAILGGSVGLDKTTGGTVVLSGANTYTGVTTVTAGTLRVAAGGVLGDAAGALVVNGGTLDLDTSVTKGTFSGAGGQVDIAGGSTLTVTQGGDQTFAGTFIGAGGFTKNGASNLTLTGTSNAYTGLTTINNGTLFVNGTLGSGASTMTVANGGTLGGSGTVGGAVTVQSGGHLAPGNSPGTLTVGTLTLNSGSISDFELGTSGVVNTTSDLVVVTTGNLTIDAGATLNLVAPAPVSGVYRLFNVNAGVVTGTAVAGSAVNFAYTGVPGGSTAFAYIVSDGAGGNADQVNLGISNGGQIVQYWDGADMFGQTGTSGGGTVDGGTGTWNASNTNWTVLPNAGINGPWASQVGVFAGTAGTVTVAGAQDFQGLQFTTTGYTINGAGTLNMTGNAFGNAAASFFNVDAGVTATVNANITGAGIGLDKIVGTGTLVLGGANTYTGDTHVAAGTLTIANTGSITSNVTNDAGAVFNNNGTVTGNVGNAGTGTNTGTITGSVSNTGGTFGNAGTITGAATISGGAVTVTAGTVGSASLTGGTLNLTGGSVTGTTTNNGGTVTNNGGALGAVTNAAGTFNNNTGTAGAVTNAGTGTNAGTVASLNNTGGTFGNAGTITGAATISGGAVTNTGTVNGGLANTGGTYTQTGAGAVTNGGTTNSATVNANGGAFNGAIANTAGAFNVGGAVTSNAGSTFTNAAGAQLNVNAGSYTMAGLAATTVLDNAGTITVANGTSLTITAGNLVNAGTITNFGTITDDLVNSSTVINNNLYNAIVASNTGTITNSFGASWNGDVLSNTGTINNFGTWTGNISNAGLWNAALPSPGGTTNVVGNFANDGTIAMQDGDTQDVLTINGTYSGTGQIDLDIALSGVGVGGAQRSDMIVVAGDFQGATTFNFTNLSATQNLIPDILVADLNNGQPNAGTATATGLPTGGLIEYALVKDGVGDWVVRSSPNLAAIGGIAGNIAVVQATIGAIVNRPSSPFVAGLAATTEPDHCGPGPWMRATGGGVQASSTTTSPLSLPATSEVTLGYAGAQFGLDLACFNVKESGVDVAAGAIAGVNGGVSSQPIANSGVTDSTFQQGYGGLYATLAKGQFSADIQGRIDYTTFNFNNGRIGLNDARLDTVRYTLSGSASYAIPVKDMALVPTAGFSLSRTDASTVTFATGHTLTPDPMISAIGFAGATLAKTIVLPDETSAVTPFATATLYNDFAPNPTSVFFDPGSGNATTITSQHLGALAEVSFGLNYVKILEGDGNGPRQINATVRADARFSDRVLGAGITGQVRAQF